MSMTREEAKELIPIIQAFAEGKEIESRCIKGDKSLWYDDEDPTFDNDLEYRIKPEPKYYPFANVEECWNEMKKHQPFGWVKDNKDGHYALVTSVLTDEKEVYIDGISGLNLYTAINYYTFVDGTPFGVKVEE